MGKDLAVIRDGPDNIKEYVEEFLQSAGPRPGRYVVTRIRGDVDVEYALKPGTMETLLREVRMGFNVTALDAQYGCLEVEVHVRLDYDGLPRIDHLTLRQTCVEWAEWRSMYG